MSDFKSKLPDFKELTSMTTKLYKGLKNSVQEIIQDYKQKRAETEATPAEENKESTKPEEKKATPPTKPQEKPITTPEENKDEVEKNSNKE
ncbi:hypothetical protein [Legionella fallonii]|uniref:Uncharacterized protein n=1 Tax=Legionella fallonii LLAP-10 TaxID=1212491 RepID=A0A098G1L2_9GAMM|nr:hypothetical protein [Legionella fallonii]CEG56357.1 conserved protein of unknown function [Legionella fallonii LLAP-10]